MTRQQTMSGIKKYFDIQELACPHVYQRFGDKSWDYIDKDLLTVLLWIREKIGKPIYVNDWQIGGSLSQRGLRCPCCQLVDEKTAKGIPYLSAHCFGKAVDFNVQGMTAEEARAWIEQKKRGLPHPVRVERNTSWVHIDVRCEAWTTMVEYFNG